MPTLMHTHEAAQSGGGHSRHQSHAGASKKITSRPISTASAHASHAHRLTSTAAPQNGTVPTHATCRARPGSGRGCLRRRQLQPSISWRGLPNPAREVLAVLTRRALHAWPDSAAARACSPQLQVAPTWIVASCLAGRWTKTVGLAWLACLLAG